MKNIKFLALILFICVTQIGQAETFVETIPDWTLITKKPFPVISPDVITNPVITASDVTEGALFVADPFIFFENEQWYMFFEALMKDTGGIGAIGLAKSSDGLRWNYDRIVLQNSWHNSYPFVLKHDGRYYMIPESYQQNAIIVYEASNFPYDWSPVSIIASGRPFVDPSIFRYNNTWWMFVSDTTSSNCYLYYSDDLLSGWIEHPKSPIVSGDPSRARPGGRSSVYDNGRIIRIAQDDTIVYGRQVKAFEVDILTKTDYSEHEISESPILQPGNGWNSTGMHHCDCWWNNDKWICVVDGKDNSGTWSIGIYVNEDLQRPIAHAGTDQTVSEGVTVNLNGSMSTDPDGTPLTYRWFQIKGLPIILSDETSPTPSFTSPRDLFLPETLIFDLVVNNGKLNSLPDSVEITVLPANPMIIYLSDINWTSATNGWGPVERDKSNGEKGSGDGNTIRLNGTSYTKGLGVHALSEITYTLNGQYSTFLSDIGLDDEIGNNGSVVFQVWGDGIKLYDSGLMTGSSATKSVNLNITGVNSLKLVVTNGGDNINYDHADWANARIVPLSTTSYTISGTITSGGNPLSGVTVNLDGPFSGTTTTNLSGLYSFIGLINGTYTVTPSLTGYTFTPESRSVNISGSNITGQDFEGIPITITSFYLSDINWTSATNGWGPVERDKSNGEKGSGDGNTIRLNGTSYTKGLGVHALSEITYTLNGQYSTFLSDIGLDDEIGNNGSVVFQVWGDGIKLYDSGLMTGSSATKSVNLNITGVNSLKLVVTNGGDNINYDHADWANARIVP